MTDQELFTAFSDEQQAEYEIEAEARWGQSVRDSSRKWQAYSAAQKAQIKAEGEQVYRALLTQLDQPPASPAVQANIARWHQHLRHFFEPSTAVLRALGAGYNDDPQFNATFQKIHPRLAPFLRAAIDVYCDQREQ